MVGVEFEESRWNGDIARAAAINAERTIAKSSRWRKESKLKRYDIPLVPCTPGYSQSICQCHQYTSGYSLFDVVYGRRSIALDTENLQKTLLSNPPIVSSRASDTLKQSYKIAYSEREKFKC